MRALAEREVSDPLPPVVNGSNRAGQLDIQRWSLQIHSRAIMLMEVVPMGRGAAMLICLLLPAAANSAVKERDINYESGSVVLVGSLAYDDALPGRRPGLLVVHEGSGLNEH